MVHSNPEERAPENPLRGRSAFQTILAIGQIVRPDQWVKNLLVLAPLAFTPDMWTAYYLLRGFLAFFVFCFASGAVYIWNDWVDLEADRLHPKKMLRPLASGRLRPRLALGLAIFLAGVALAGAGLAGKALLLVVTGYVLLQFLYSLVLKRLVILDVMAVATGFVLRALAGGVSVDIQVSNWFLVTTSLLALFLGFTKRRQELGQLRDSAAQHRTVLAQYNITFIDQMNAALAGGCIVCYALFTVAPETVQKFGTDALVATFPFVVYGLLRYLYLVHVHNLGDNPTELFLQDRALQICIVLWLLTFLWIIHAKP